MHMVTAIWAAEFVYGEFQNDSRDTIKALAIAVKEHVDGVLQPSRNEVPVQGLF